ncbi:hypothetical protein RIF29_34412 [Crotalaria pallida]|uniref:Uncharacterized protein n=1 Tax=Crotalaria pallida TaxID=3830 RepID=A0AAN9EET2_CROPI
MVYLPHVSKYPIEYENDFIGRIAEEFSNKINRGVPLHAESQLLEINLLHAEFDNGVRETTKRVVEDDTILWRFVGFVSSIVGLLCYALSPSFTRLIRGWNPLKLGLYVVLAYIIWAIILLAKQRPFSWKSKLTTMVGFVIFMLSNAYSFYFDKVMSGKPDILSMVSNVAFALMAVSFSKVFKIGSDFGVLSCFLALLAAQLMTIHFLLIFVAIFIGFPLFVMNSTLVSKLKVRSPGQNIHSSSHSQPPEVNSGGQAFQPSSNSQPEVGNEGQDIFSSSNSPQVEDGSEGEHAITLIL